MNIPFLKSTSQRLVVTFLILVASANWVYADSNNDEYVNEVHGVIGLGVKTIPKFLGSDKTKAEAFPTGQLSYGRFFVGGSAGLGIGYNAFEAGDFTFGTFVNQQLDSPRKESDDIRLKGLGDVKATSRGGLFTKYERDWLRTSADLSWDIGGKKQGLLAIFSAEATFRPVERLELSAGPKIIYGNSEYVNTVFGINQVQSVNSGLALYKPKGGISEAAMEFGATYLWDKNWILGSKVIIGKLEGDSAKSAIVEKKSQNSIGVFVAYKF